MSIRVKSENSKKGWNSQKSRKSRKGTQLQLSGLSEHGKEAGKLNPESESNINHHSDTADSDEHEQQRIENIIKNIIKFRRRNFNVWESVCKDVEKELVELDLILTKIGIPPHNYHKDKKFPVSVYHVPPDRKTCFARDFLDYYVFPHLIPAIQALVRFATRNRVFQCRYCTFNALDYIVEYLYNNNPNHPERALDPVPLFEIPFAKAWVARYPRKPYPKWLTMSEEDACLIIQCAVRGWLVRKRDNIQALRQQWKDSKKGYHRGDSRRKVEPEAVPLLSQYYCETLEEFEVETPTTPPPLMTHSDLCFVCNRFRDFIRRQQELIMANMPEDLLNQLDPSNEEQVYDMGENEMGYLKQMSKKMRMPDLE